MEDEDNRLMHLLIDLEAVEDEIHADNIEEALEILEDAIEDVKTILFGD